jgi:hypothetical protein
MTLRIAASKARKGTNWSQDRSRGDQAGVLLPEIAAQVLQRGLRGGLVDGGVDRAHRGGGFLALVPGDVLQRRADQVGVMPTSA